MSPEALESMASYGITPSRDLARLQAEANREGQARYRQSSLGALTWDTAVADAHDALVGLTADLSGTTERHSLKEMLSHGDRLRGLGVLLIGVALVGLFADYVMRSFQ